MFYKQYIINNLYICPFKRKITSMNPISAHNHGIKYLTVFMLCLSFGLSAHNVKDVLKSVHAAFETEASAADYAEINNKIVFMKSPHRKKVRKVVIDAGHGGHDSGCVGKNSQEKNLTLQMALKLGNFISQAFPDVVVLQTRTTDVFIPLFRRIQFANEEDADLFISIHCNYISNKQTKGTETFVMGLHRAGDNLEVAKRENASILLEHNYEQNYDGYDPNSPEGHIILSMYQNAYLDKSIEFAAGIENAFTRRSFTKSRGVKQAGFAVLRRSSMPAVLVEAGFLSNEDEEAYLISEEGQNAVAASILKSFENFYIKYLKDPELASSEKYKDDSYKPVADKNAKAEPVKSTAKDAKTASEQKTKTGQSIQKISEPNKSETKTGEYGVQIAALKNAQADMDSSELRKVGKLLIRKSGDVHKYLVGHFQSHEEASKAKEQLKKIGYSGAFVVNINGM
jgi:N-acetylmuramoyl-L-alanine amidase